MSGLGTLAAYARAQQQKKQQAMATIMEMMKAGFQPNEGAVPQPREPAGPQSLRLGSDGHLRIGIPEVLRQGIANAMPARSVNPANFAAAPWHPGNVQRHATDTGAEQAEEDRYSRERMQTKQLTSDEKIAAGSQRIAQQRADTEQLQVQDQGVHQAAMRALEAQRVGNEAKNMVLTREQMANNNDLLRERIQLDRELGRRGLELRSIEVRQGGNYLVEADDGSIYVLDRETGELRKAEGPSDRSTLRSDLGTLSMIGQLQQMAGELDDDTFTELTNQLIQRFYAKAGEEMKAQLDEILGGSAEEAPSEQVEPEEEKVRPFEGARQVLTNPKGFVRDTWRNAQKLYGPW